MSKKHKNGQADTQEQQLAEVQRELDTVKVDVEEARNQLKRAIADYQNLEKRVDESKVEFAAWANAELLKKIVPVLDHFDQALGGSGEDSSEGWRKGVELAVKELRKVLENEGLVAVQTDQFDPSLHEAVEVVGGEDGKILKVVGMGYTLNGRILKPAKVVVGKKGET